jgi:hypothetical protein
VTVTACAHRFSLHALTRREKGPIDEHDGERDGSRDGEQRPSEARIKRHVVGVGGRRRLGGLFAAQIDKLHRLGGSAPEACAA